MSARPPGTRRAVAPAVAAAVLLAAGPARAHDPFQITVDARLRSGRLDLRVVMMDGTAIKLCRPPAGAAAMDAGATSDVKLDAASFATWRPRLEACASEVVTVSAGGAPLQARAARARLSVENDVELDVEYPQPRRSPLRFDAVGLGRLSDPTYGAELTVVGESVFLGQALLRARQSALEIPLSADGTDAPPVAAPVPSFGEFLRLGIEHILTGYDHLAFLAGLLVVCRRFRSVLTIVTCFTIAHSITLALAALDLVRLSGRVVEPLIAATIVFVGVENLVRGDEPRGRWALTFSFGLLHGFGFAGALKEIGLGARGAPVLAPLFSFNLGVELGQVAVAAVALPVLWRLRRVPWFARHGRTAVSALVSALGVFWLVRRTVL